MEEKTTPCKLGVPQTEKARRWCVTHNQMLHFCNPDPRSDEGVMKQAREIVKGFWSALPEHYQTLWLLEGPCEELTETIFAALQAAALTQFNSEGDET